MERSRLVTTVQTGLHCAAPEEVCMHVLVTGAASGIGRATCLRLARDARARGQAAKIAAVDLGPSPELDRLVEELRKLDAEALALRSEERRVGEEGRSRWSPDHLKKKKTD